VSNHGACDERRALVAELGNVLDSVSTGPGKLNDSVREGIRNFFNDSVRGRGPVPALRVGDQPYGILPVGNTDVRWKAQRGDLLDETLLNFLKRVRGTWRVSLPNVPRIDRGGAGLDTTVLASRQSGRAESSRPHGDSE
jgi:hypothetical protein